MPKTIFARKPVDLDQLKSDVADLKRLFNSQGDAYYVAEELQLSNQEWERLTEDFLADRPCFHQFSEKNLPVTEEGTPCIRVTTPGSEFALIIDTQGYDYARYVGFEANDSSEIEDEDELDWDEDSHEEEESLTEDEVVDGLRALLMGESLDCTSLEDNAFTRTYEEGGYLTYDKGFTIHMADGSVFQVTVKQER